MEKFKAKIFKIRIIQGKALKSLRRQFKINTYVSLRETYILTEKRLKYAQILLNFLIFFFLLCLLGVIEYIASFLAYMCAIPSFLILLAFNRKYNRFKGELRKPLIIRNKLLMILETNKLYETLVDNNKKEYISRSAQMDFLIEDSCIRVKAYVIGDKWSKQMRELEPYLVGALGLELKEKKDFPRYSEYIFEIIRPERLNVVSTGKKQVNKSPEINLGYGVVYNPVKTPHALIAGGTGSGKSILITYLIIEFFKNDSTVFIADPKNADLGSLSHYLGDERVATSPNNIARIVRNAKEEMMHRYDYMNENFKYGSNYVDHDFKPVWLVFDEMGAFAGSATDKKSKEVVGEVMAGIKQIILLGRQAGVFILIAAQQMNATVLNTELRDNLGLRIALGSNSSEGYRMVFGGNTPETIPPIETKGAGLLYMQGSGKESAQYWEAPFIDLKNYDFIEELQRYI